MFEGKTFSNVESADFSVSNIDKDIESFKQHLDDLNNPQYLEKKIQNREIVDKINREIYGMPEDIDV